MKGQSQRARRQRVREVLTLLGKPVCQQILVGLRDGAADATALSEVVDRSTSTLRKYLARLCVFAEQAAHLSGHTDNGEHFIEIEGIPVQPGSVRPGARR